MKSTSSRLIAAACLLANTLVLGCASTPVGKKDLVSVLSRESVTRGQVRAQLGEPSASFENGGVVAYRLGENKSGYFVVPHTNGWEGVRYDLIVEFDTHDIVTGHNLIAVREH